MYANGAAEIIKVVSAASCKPGPLSFPCPPPLSSSLPVPVSLGQMVCVSSTPVLIFHYGPLPPSEREMLHNVWVCLFNPMKNAGAAGGRSAWKGKWRRRGKGTKWMRGGCEEAEARREKETKAG